MRKYCAFCLSWFSQANHPAILGGPVSPDARELITAVMSWTNQTLLVGAGTRYDRRFLLERGEFPTVSAWIDFMERFGDGFFYHDVTGQPVYPIAVTSVKGYDVCVSHIPGQLNMARM